MADKWDDLAGSEVRERLEHRGVTPTDAWVLWNAHERGNAKATKRIGELLRR